MRFKREETLREDVNGAVIVAATVSIYLAGGTTPATAYASKTSPTVINSVITDSKGRYIYYVDDTDYPNYQLFKEIITKTGYTTITYDDIDIIETIFDHLSLSGVATYADNAAALAGGLTVGMVYKTATGQLMIVYTP